VATHPFVEKIQALVQGISQQAQGLRYKGQVEDATNMDFSVVDGARKRPGGETIAAIVGSAASSVVNENTQYRMHKIERDDQEEYAVIYGRGLLEVVDLGTGETATITRDTDAETYIATSTAYADDLRFVTIADTTMIVNTKRTTRVQPGTGGADIDDSRMPVALVRTGLNPLTFELKMQSFGGRKFFQQKIDQSSGTTTSGTFTLSYLGYTTTHTLEYDANSSDVQKALEGNGIDPDDHEDGIDGLQPFPYGKIICTGGPLPTKPVYVNISSDLDVTEMLVCDASQLVGGAYAVARGDEDRDPAPEFIRNEMAIRDISYFRNRLCFASDEFMSFSRSDDLFNFFLDTPITITDADPIELQLSATDVNIIDFLVPYRNAIIALTQSGQQFELTSGDSFTSSTAAVTPTTRYSTQKVRPVLNGSNLFMAGASNGYSTLLEYYFDEASVSNLAVNVAQHVDTLLPPNMVKIVTTNTTNAVYCFPTLDGDVTAGQTMTSAATGVWNVDATWVGNESPQPNDTAIIASGHTVSFTGYESDLTFVSWEQNPGLVSRIYAYRWYNAGQERKQSSWARWDFAGDAIQDAICVDDDMFIMRRHKSLADDAVRLKIDKLKLAQTTADTTPANRKVYMDHMIQVTGVHDDGDPGVTTWSLTDAQSDSSYNVIVKADGTELTGFTNTTSGAGDGPKITLAGNHAGASLIGRKVVSEIVLSEPFPRTPQGEPLEDGRLTLKKLVVGHRRSGPYSVEVDSQLPSICPTRTTSKTDTAIEDGELTVPSAGQARDIRLTMTSDNSYPVTWSSIEWHGSFTTITE
jgi:outer membrane lipoprotein SlyB